MAIENSPRNRRTRIKNRWKQCFRLPFVGNRTTNGNQKLFLTRFDLRSSIVKSVFDCHLPGVMFVLSGKIFPTQSVFRSTLKELWFNLYPRSSSLNFDDSSGFEHVMVGELNGGKVSGFHSWLQFYLQEKAGNLQFSSLVADKQVSLRIRSRPRGYKTFFMLNSADHEIYPVHNVKMPTVIGILTFISMINTTSERLKAIYFFICRYLSVNEQLKFHAQLS